MSHHIYQTEGVVLGGFNVGESNRFLYILTKDLGLIAASVQSVRELKSKLCYSLQDFSYSKIDLVRGREVWRVTSAQSLRTLLPTHGNLLKTFQHDSLRRKIFANIISLTKRLFTGEVAHDELFDELILGLTFLGGSEFNEVELRNFEIVMALKILDSLGYLTKDRDYEYFLTKTDWNKGILAKITPMSKKAVKDINEALKETQM